MANNIKIKRGLKAGLPNLEVGEFGLATDTNEVFIGTPTGNKLVNSSGGGEVDLNEMSYFDYAGSIYGDKYSLLANAWESSLAVDPSEISKDGALFTYRGKAQYPNGETEGVIIPQGVTTIGNSAFGDWTSNNQPLVIPNSVTSIGDDAFYNWTSNNQPLVIPESVTSIGQYAFRYWQSNNQPLVIPNSVTSIGNSAFDNWTSNNQPLVIPNSVTSIGNEVFRKWESNNQPLVIPNSVTSIGIYAFGYWEANNQPLVIPNSITSIGNFAFYNWKSNNQPLVIPDSITSIGQYAFKGWQLVSYVEIQAITPPTLSGSSAFDGQNNAPIYVPDESVDDYKEATQWVDLADRIFPISDRNSGEDVIPEAPEDGKLYGRKNAEWSEIISGCGGGGITTSNVQIPFTELMTETQTTIGVQYNYIGDDPVNFTADFSNFTLGGGLTIDMGSGPVPPSMAVQMIFGKTTLNYFEIIILFRYLLEATLGGVIGDGSSNLTNILFAVTADYAGISAGDAFDGISDVNINGATFTVDFITQCQDIPLFGTVTGRGSDMSVEVETAGGLSPLALVYGGVQSEYFSQAWDNLSSGYTLYYNQQIGGMTLKLVPNIKMKVNYNGGMFLD